MNSKTRHIVFVLLSLFLTTLVEKAIPHSHIESEGVVKPDWENKKDASNEDSNSENLHSSFYQLSSLDSSLKEIVTENVFNIDLNQSINFESQKIADYNILPKVLNNILLIVHTYSSNAPPLYS